MTRAHAHEKPANIRMFHYHVICPSLSISYTIRTAFFPYYSTPILPLLTPTPSTMPSSLPTPFPDLSNSCIIWPASFSPFTSCLPYPTSTPPGLPSSRPTPCCLSSLTHTSLDLPFSLLTSFMFYTALSNSNIIWPNFFPSNTFLPVLTNCYTIWPCFLPPTASCLPSQISASFDLSSSPSTPSCQSSTAVTIAILIPAFFPSYTFLLALFISYTI
ncbi:hepatitis A virus cellular receptor 1-like [Palaemon carinicauda]|uniref:hepatitis A virus cellular receptor 1-like n=1 Tax=Palaemon carinicauda TaxID=392227 RepID=UPI0035B5B30F